MDNADQLKQEILRLSAEFARLKHAGQRPGNSKERPAFIPGVTPVPYAGRVFDSDEVAAAVGGALDFWLTLGSEGEAFERELAAWLGVKSSLLVNSGSSANLVAVSTLTSPRLKERRLRPGDEVITVAAGFPTTVAPLIQAGAVPVFIDNDPATGNARCDRLEAAFREGKTRAVMMAHTLGNPFDLAAVTGFCERHDLWLIEDNCDALGATYTLQRTAESAPLSKKTGNWGDLSTQSFYPPHHLTLGEGGAVNVVKNFRLRSIAESFRDWGRECWCASGQDNTCGKRFDWQLGELPHGYDHKYVYGHLGYNLKPLDLQAAIGRVQLRRLDGFVQARRENWEYLRTQLADLGEHFEFMKPTHAASWESGGWRWEAGVLNRCEPSWFGFMMLVRPGAPFTRTQLARALDGSRIGNRMLFGGNLVRQPVFVTLARENPGAFRVCGDLEGADRLMNHALFVGTYPGLTREMLDYMVEVIREFVRRH